ncbi:MAG: hypothetical protein AMXMBFR64_57800 [Myxococcales bacterium]
MKTLAVLLLTLTLVRPAAADGPADIPDLFASSFAYETTGDLDRALNDALRVVRVEPSHYVATLRAGWLYYLKGRYGDSVDLYQKAVKLAPNAAEPKLGLMLPLMAAGRWGEAEAVGEQVLAKAPRNYLAASRLAYCAFSQGRWKVAEQRYKEVLDDYPGDLEMMLGLAWTWAKQGRAAEAKGLFQKVLVIRKDNVNARAGLDSL